MVSGKAKPVMPMGGGEIAAGEIDIIKNWIDAGAKPPAPGEMARKAKDAVAHIQPKVAPRPQVFALAYRPDGKTIAAAGYKEVRLLDSNARVQGSLTGHAETVRSVAFSPDGKLLAAAGGLPARKGEVKIWDVDSRTELKTIQGHADCIYAVVFSPDAKTIATASYDKLIKIWDVQTGKEVRTLKDHIDAVYALAFTSDGKRLISGAADRTVKIWNPATGERLYTFGEPADGINSIAVHGNLVTAGGLDKSIRLWELGEASGRLLNTVIAHEDAILKVAFSPDGKLIVSSSADRTIKVFNTADLSEVKTIPGQPDWTYGIEFAPDGKTFVAGRYDGSVSIYDTQQFRDLTETRRASR
jgi:WD40 repeat protein